MCLDSDRCIKNGNEQFFCSICYSILCLDFLQVIYSKFIIDYIGYYFLSNIFLG